MEVMRLDFSWYKGARHLQSKRWAREGKVQLCCSVAPGKKVMYFVGVLGAQKPETS